MSNEAMREALAALVEVIDAAGLLNLSKGVQLGPTVWYVKASERLESARAALAQAEQQKEPVGQRMSNEAMREALRRIIAEHEREKAEQRKPGECWPESVMQQWDYWRKQIANGDASSAPRDWFESLAPQSEQRQEAVAIVEGEHVMVGEEVWFAARCTAEKIPVGTKLYTSPQPREWVSLTEEEINAAYDTAALMSSYHGVVKRKDVYNNIEAKLREKNGGNV